MTKSKKLGRPWPDWALGLASGRYTIDDIMPLATTTRRQVQNFLRTHAKSVGTIEKRNKILKVYEWENEQTGG